MLVLEKINHVMNFQDIRSRSVDIFLGNQLIPWRNKCTCDHFNRWIKNVFRTNSKMWAGELSKGSASRAHLYRSEAPQPAEARSTKIVFVRRNFWSSRALQPIASVSVNDLWRRSNATTRLHLRRYRASSHPMPSKQVALFFSLVGFTRLFALVYSKT